MANLYAQEKLNTFYRELLLKIVIKWFLWRRYSGIKSIQRCKAYLHQSRFGLVNFLSHAVQHHLCPLCVFMVAVSAYEAKVNNEKVLFGNPTRNKGFL